MLGIGIQSRIESKDWGSLLGDDRTIVIAANALIVSGVFIILFGILGCVGTYKEDRFLFTSVFRIAIVASFGSVETTKVVNC